MFNASKAVLRRPQAYEHVGLGWRDAVSRAADLTAAAKETGCTRFLYDHMEQLAPCFAMVPDDNRLTLTLDVDTSAFKDALDALAADARRTMDGIYDDMRRRRVRG